MSEDNILGAILAGGQSKRMGKDKLFLELNNKKLIEHTIDKVKKYLKKNGFKISSCKLFGSPDIVLKRKKIAIFVDGCFWHKCRKHYIQTKTRKSFWIKKINQNVRREKIVKRTIRKDG